MSNQASLGDISGSADFEDENEKDQGSTELQRKRVGEVIELVKGKKPEEVFEEKREGAVHYLTVGTMTDGSIKYTTDTDLPKAKKQDSVMIMDGSKSGRCYYGNEGVVGSTMAVLRPQRVNPFYLNQFLTENFNRLNSATRGSAVPHTDKDLLRGLEIVDFPIGEQRRIASVLYNVDQAISKTEEIIEQTQRVKKGLMQDFFSEFDAVRRNQNPEEYSYEDLGDLVDFKSGNAFKTKNLSDEGMKVVRISNLNDPDHDYWTYDGDYNEDWIVEDGDLLFTWAGLKTSIDVHIYRGEEALLNQHIYNLFPTEQIGKKYLYYYLGYVMPQLYATSSGGAKQMHLTKSQISKVTVPILDEGKRNEIVTSLSSVDKKIRNLEEQKEQLQRLKKGLMQDLLTGSVRTGEDVRVLDEVLEVEG